MLKNRNKAVIAIVINQTNNDHRSNNHNGSLGLAYFRSRSLFLFLCAFFLSPSAPCFHSISLLSFDVTIVECTPCAPGFGIDGVGGAPCIASADTVCAPCTTGFFNNGSNFNCTGQLPRFRLLYVPVTCASFSVLDLASFPHYIYQLVRMLAPLDRVSTEKGHRLALPLQTHSVDFAR